MKIKNNQSGVAHVAIVIIIVFVLLLAFVGYRITQKKDEPVAKSTSNAAKATNDTEKATDTDKNGGETKFLTIKEWGVKFALTTDTADAYYDTKTSSNLDSMSLRSHSLDSEADCTTGPQSVASIFRVPKDIINEQTSKKYSEGGDGNTIGEYYYFIQSSQYMCTQDTEKAIILQGVRNSFNVAGPTIVKA